MLVRVQGPEEKCLATDGRIADREDRAGPAAGQPGLVLLLRQLIQAEAAHVGLLQQMRQLLTVPAAENVQRCKSV
jgi:hypothetical protein